jgi:hypothetical protein
MMRKSRRRGRKRPIVERIAVQRGRKAQKRGHLNGGRIGGEGGGGWQIDRGEGMRPLQRMEEGERAGNNGPAFPRGGLVIASALFAYDDVGVEEREEGERNNK